VRVPALVVPYLKDHFAKFTLTTDGALVFTGVTADTTNCPETATKLPGGGHEICPTRVRLPRRVPRLRPLLGCGCGAEAPTAPRRDTVKSAEEIMNMLDAFDLTGSLRDAGELAGVSHH